MALSKHALLHSFAVGVSCLALGYFLAKRTIPIPSFHTRLLPHSHSHSPPPSPSLAAGPHATLMHHVEVLADQFDDFKMVLVVRNDLKMGKGKVAAQCSHATLGLYKKVFYRAPKALQRWEMCSQVKVVTRVESEEEMFFLQTRAKTMKLPCHITVDAGRTQISPNSKTVLAILGPANLVDEITGSLKLL
ncbi:hypothetical protein M758_7G187700 [Ceratodon purpureus]|nr:hypothetical protein M758_7G187700 [Ceratodon purpureus]